MKFGKGWFGIIFNPVGYMAQRKSVGESANQYGKNNPIRLTGAETALQLEDAKQKWVDACAAKLKSDDVGKSLANSTRACAGVWDNSTEVLNAVESVNEQQNVADATAREDLQRNIKLLVFLLLIAICVFVIIKIL